MSQRVVVVGSLSVDFVMRVPRRPQKGETIIGSDFNTYVGGKGNNQALAAAKAGAQVSMVGNVGKDTYGDTIASNLNANQVDSTFLFRDDRVGTGIANIYVDPEGDNSIVIVTQANGKLSPKKLAAAEMAISKSSVLLLQLEIPIETVTLAATIARKGGAKVILNPAPAPPSGSLPDELLKNVDIFVPNQTECELLTGVSVNSEADAKQAAEKLHKRGPKCVLITMGEHGAYVSDLEQGAFSVPAFKITAIDTTAAGDAFCGAFAAALAQGKSLHEAALFGCAAGALACTRHGAAPSLPTAGEINQLIGLSVPR